MKYSINYLETIPEMFGKSMKENKDQDLFIIKRIKIGCRSLILKQEIK